MRIAVNGGGRGRRLLRRADGGGRPRRVLHRARRQSRGDAERTASRSRACTATCICPRSNVTDDPKSVGPVDIVLFAVKLWDTETAAEQTKPLVGPDTRVITLQNGIDSVERIAPILGAEQTVGGAAYIASVIASPGVIKQTSHFAKMRFGRADKRPDATLQAFADAGKAAKIDVDISADINVELWEKFIFLTAMAGSTASMRAPIGVIRADPELRGFLPRADGGGLCRRQSQGRRARARFHRRADEILGYRSSPA